MYVNHQLHVLFFIFYFFLISLLHYYIQVYFDMMKSFRTEFDDLFAEGMIDAIEIGLGASGELK